MSEIKLIKTEDGSHSLYVPGLNEIYHSFHGALHESMHVFIKQGFKYWLEKHKGNEVRILEVGFGTGLNVLLTLKEQKKYTVDVTFSTIEPYPLSEHVVKQLNYAQILGERWISDAFDQIHGSAWEHPVQIQDGFVLTKHRVKLENFEVNRNQFDIVYFDAFAPNKQSGLWTKGVFKKMYSLMKKGGVLVTYCAKGQVKRDLEGAGFSVGTLPGPPGKKEMTRGVK